MMNIFFPSPEAQITARHLPPTQPTVAAPQIEVTLTAGLDTVAGLAQTRGGCVAVMLIDKRGQPQGQPTALARNMRPVPLFIDSALATPITQHIERSLRNRSAWGAAFAQLSWMPHTEFGDKIGLSVFARISLKAVDWIIFGAGLVIGLAALPTIYPIVRCVTAYNAVTALQDGMADLQLANQLLLAARALPELTAATAQNILQVYRGQACRPRMLSVEHRSGWSSLAETELLTYLDTKVPGFSLQLRAQDARNTRNAMLLKLGTHAMILATQAAALKRTEIVRVDGGAAEKSQEKQKWDQLALRPERLRLRLKTESELSGSRWRTAKN